MCPGASQLQANHIPQLWLNPSTVPSLQLLWATDHPVLLLQSCAQVCGHAGHRDPKDKPTKPCSTTAQAPLTKHTHWLVCPDSCWRSNIWMLLFPISHCYVKGTENSYTLQSKAVRDQGHQTPEQAAQWPWHWSSLLRLHMSTSFPVCRQSLSSRLPSRIWSFHWPVTFKIFTSTR